MSSIVRIPTLVFAFVAAAAPVVAVTIVTPGVPITENFNSLAATGTSSTLPAGWALLETLANADTNYAAGTGSSTTGDTYSFGSAALPADRALGTLQSGSLVSTIGTVVTNSTGGVITSLAISYVGEQWRLGAVGRPDQLDFGYSSDATGLGNGVWNEVNSLDFVAPNTGPTTGALDGNLAINRTAISFTITGLNLANGASLWLRWTDFNATSFDDGLAIDDFSITAPAQGVPDQLPLVVAAVLFAGLFLVAKRRGSHW